MKLISVEARESLLVSELAHAIFLFAALGHWAECQRGGMPLVAACDASVPVGLGRRDGSLDAFRRTLRALSEVPLLSHERCGGKDCATVFEPKSSKSHRSGRKIVVSESGGRK